MQQRWTPSVTVAAIIEADGRYLLVEEHTPEGLRLNNPAGHLEPGESPEQGVVREALEETARAFTPEALVGVYLARFQRPARGPPGRTSPTCASPTAATSAKVQPGRALDTGIVRTLWLTLDEVRDSAARHRSPLVLRCIEDHAAGRRHPLGVLTVDPSLWAPALPVPLPTPVTTPVTTPPARP
jgi:8-oxo-dGTP pyrophosphatase MutT (NUDIX family)